MASKAKSAIPPGYVFLNLETFMTCKGKDLVEDLLKKAAKRNPDAFDMYIYNDFYPYAVLDLVDKTLSTAHTKFVKKEIDEVYCILEALTVFNDLESSWPTCDDGKRVILTDKIYGALVVNLFRTLKSEGRLNTDNFANLEVFLKNVAEWGDAMPACGSDYCLVCKTIGRRLFANKSVDTLALEKARVEEWISGLSKADQVKVRQIQKGGSGDSDDEDDDDDDGEPWYIGDEDKDESSKDSNFNLARVWKEYRAYLASVPSGPMRGPKSWDISKWTAAQKREFEFDSDESS